jgi:predicted GNAT family N-acyltransferase
MLRRELVGRSRWSVELANSEADRQEIFQLRYRVYVDEMEKPYPNADVTAASLSDQLDIDGLLFILRDDHGTVAGTVRGNAALDVISHDPALATRLHLDQLGRQHLLRATICSRLVMTRRERRRGAVVPLLQAIYQWGVVHGVQLNLIHTANRLVPFFRHLGFCAFGEAFYDSDAGCEQQPMRLFLDDREHLRRVGSPFYVELLPRQTVVT